MKSVPKHYLNPVRRLGGHIMLMKGVPGVDFLVQYGRSGAPPLCTLFSLGLEAEKDSLRMLQRAGWVVHEIDGPEEMIAIMTGRTADALRIVDETPRRANDVGGDLLNRKD